LLDVAEETLDEIATFVEVAMASPAVEDRDPLRQIDLVKPLWKQSASVAIQQKRLNAMNRGNQSGSDKSRAP
jgi:hypothetical protein